MIGRLHECCSSIDAIFDGRFTTEGAPYTETMYHSTDCSGSDYGGVTVTFNNPIEYIDLEIYTRTDCCRDRYNRLGAQFFDKSAFLV